MDLNAPLSPHAARALLDWYLEAGVNTVESDLPADFANWPVGGPKLLPPQAPAATQVVPSRKAITADDAPMPTDEAVALAGQLAAKASSLEELVQAIESFEGCPLKGGARNTVVYDGVLGAKLLVLGEAPGREEDRIGKPFIGRAGMLLDRMLAAIGLSRTQSDGLQDACITNAIYWRPPGNRNPTQAEISICQPFVQRFIALSKPQLIVLAGNVPTQAMLPGTPGITRARGKWKSVILSNGQEISALPLFHPAFLLRQPAQKRLAWADLLSVKARLR